MRPDCLDPGQGKVRDWLKAKKRAETMFRLLRKELATTYSRGSYTTTTIGKTAFDGRVRNGIGSDHSFMATKVLADGHGRFRGVMQRFCAARPDLKICKRTNYLRAKRSGPRASEFPENYTQSA